MKKLTKETKEKLAHEIYTLLKDRGLIGDVRIYYGDKCLTHNGLVLENTKASDYFKYVNEDTLSMSFEGAFYEVLNYCESQEDERTIQEFNKLLASYGLYYELGDYWNLTLFYLKPEMNDTSELINKKSKEPIYISRHELSARA